MTACTLPSEGFRQAIGRVVADATYTPAIDGARFYMSPLEASLITGGGLLAVGLGADNLYERPQVEPDE